MKPQLCLCHCTKIDRRPQPCHIMIQLNSFLGGSPFRIFESHRPCESVQGEEMLSDHGSRWRLLDGSHGSQIFLVPTCCAECGCGRVDQLRATSLYIYVCIYINIPVCIQKDCVILHNFRTFTIFGVFGGSRYTYWEWFQNTFPDILASMFFMSVLAKSEAQILYPLMQCTDIFFLKVEGETVVGAVP